MKVELKDDYIIEQRDEDIYEVTSIEGKTYIVNLKENYCTCEDYQYRKARDAGDCKHLAMLKQQQPTQAIAHVGDKERFELAPALTPERLLQITQKRVCIDAIIRSSEDGMGRGVLYEQPVNVPYPIVKADLVEMLARNFGIVSETISTEYKKIEDKEGNEILLITKTARATHIPTGASVVRSATVPFDFKRLRREEREDFEGRTFADRTAESAACKRAELALMGIPERSLVELVKMMIRQYKEKGGTR